MRWDRGKRVRAPLWRDRDFLNVWSAATVSQLGSQVTLMAVPFIALRMLDASAFEVSLIATVEMLPFLLFTLPAGAWLDRVRRRPVLIAADLARAAALLTIPLAYLGGALALWQLYAVAFVTGTCSAFFDVASQSYLPALIERDDLVEGNGDLQTSYSVAQMGGPYLAGSLLQLVAAPFAVAVDAASFAASALFIFGIRRPEPEPERQAAPHRPSLRADVAIGLRYVWHNRYLRSIAGSTATSNLFGSALFAVLPVLIWNELRLGPAFFGSVMALASVGFLAGAALSGWLPRRFGFGPTIVVSSFLAGPAFLLVALTPAEPVSAAVCLFVGWFLAGSSQVVYNVAQISLRQAITPLAMQSRMNATMRFLVWGTIPIGSLFGGMLAAAISVRAALVLAGLASFLAVAWVLASPVRTLRDIPDLAVEDVPGPAGAALVAEEADLLEPGAYR